MNQVTRIPKAKIKRLIAVVNLEVSVRVRIKNKVVTPADRVKISTLLLKAEEKSQLINLSGKESKQLVVLKHLNQTMATIS